MERGLRPLQLLEKQVPLFRKALLPFCALRARLEAAMYLAHHLRIFRPSATMLDRWGAAGGGSDQGVSLA